MAGIWSDEGKLARWLDVELAALDGWAEVGVVPAEAFERIRGRAVPPDPARVAEWGSMYLSMRSLACRRGATGSSVERVGALLFVRPGLRYDQG